MGIADKFRSLFQSSAKLDVSKRFEILREAVSGTMSKFYKVRDRESGQVVGLKIGDLEKTGFFEGRFTGLNKPSEGEIAIQFDHPRIVRTLEYGTTTLDEHYLIMEFLDGPGLNAFIMQKSALLDGKRVNLIREMCEALQVVHDRLELSDTIHMLLVDHQPTEQVDLGQELEVVVNNTPLSA